MAIGLSGAPASFQHLMDTILRDLPLVTTHWDDVLTHSPSIEENFSLDKKFSLLKSCNMPICEKYLP